MDKQSSAGLTHFSLIEENRYDNPFQSLLDIRIGNTMLADFPPCSKVTGISFSAEALATTVANSYSPGKGQLIPRMGKQCLPIRAVASYDNDGSFR